MSIEKYISTDWRVENVFDGSTKTAGVKLDTHVPPEIEEFARNVEPDPKFCYAHMIAMSDASHYGSNLNGDRFRSDELTAEQPPEEAAKNRGKFKDIQVPRYKTFETAKFYRNHANSPSDPHYGDVPVAAWNEPMQRVELVIRIYRDAAGMGDGACPAPDIIGKLERGDTLNSSMGCRIHHERCEYCGHENELVKDRCDHLKYMMNRIMPDGRKVSADNFGPNFFDISDVGIPADPVASSLGKVAAADVLDKPKTANVAKDVTDLFQFATKSAWRKKWAEMEKEVPTSTPISALTPDSDVQSTHEFPTQLSEQELKAMLDASNGDIDSVVSTLTACGVVLSPVELAHLSQLATPEGAVQHAAPTSVALNKFAHAVYAAAQSAIDARSGFNTPVLASGWEPTKIAESGEDSAVEMAAYYAYYRTLISSLPVSDFTKEAYRNSAVRAIGGETIDYNRVKTALHHLAHAGLATI